MPFSLQWTSLDNLVNVSASLIFKGWSEKSRQPWSCYLCCISHIFDEMYHSSCSAVFDFSKYFYNFPTSADNRPYLGLVQPCHWKTVGVLQPTYGEWKLLAIACQSGVAFLLLITNLTAYFKVKCWRTVGGLASKQLASTNLKGLLFHSYQCLKACGQEVGLCWWLPLPCNNLEPSSASKVLFHRCCGLVWVSLSPYKMTSSCSICQVYRFWFWPPTFSLCSVLLDPNVYRLFPLSNISWSHFWSKNSPIYHYPSAIVSFNHGRSNSKLQWGDLPSISLWHTSPSWLWCWPGS